MKIKLQLEFDITRASGPLASQSAIRDTLWHWVLVHVTDELAEDDLFQVEGKTHRVELASTDVVRGES